MKTSTNLSLLFNQFNNFSPEHKNEPANVVYSKYCDIDQIQTLKFPEKNKSLSLFHIIECSLSKNLDNEHQLKCRNKVFNIVAVSEIRISKKTSLTSNINLQNYSFEFAPTKPNARETLLYIANHLSYNTQ